MRRRRDQHGGLPIKLGPASNGEFVPPPASPVVREAIRLSNDEAEVVARRLGISRRRFLASLGGSALTLLVLDACASAERAT
ncbi:MAG: amidohydrolase, partial [Actinomycetia bacterium]|nr:amidohydrolase [Actinomycetes bacterium]